MSQPSQPGGPTPPRRQIFVASNRGPVAFSFNEDGSLTENRGGGGMVSGLMSGLAAATGTDDVLWVCAALSDADRAAAKNGIADGVPPVKMLDIKESTLDEAYNRIANSVLWFTHHMLFDTPSQPRFEPPFGQHWDSYLDYNAAFADALAEQATPAARTLIQDYHLALAPRLLRDRRPDARIAHFSHTPWAPPDYYRLLPDDVAAALLDGMLGADHAGFLAERWARAFIDCCRVVLGAEVTFPDGLAGRVRHRGHSTDVAVHPLGVEADPLRVRAAQEDVAAHAAAFVKAAAGRKLIVRVDRTELSKNILRGLAAYRALLAGWPHWRGKVTHLALAYPSRSGLAEYRRYTEQVGKLAEQINAEFGTADWTPVLLEVKDDYPRSLAACQVADVLLVNPIRDGMNLVAEEGPIVSARGCALVLSREAGAAAVLGEDAILVNPFDVPATAKALVQALEMPLTERARRTASLTTTANRYAPPQWLAAQLDALG